MDLKETSNKLSKIKLDEETKEAFFGLVDDKINNDMREVISEMKGLRSEMSTIIDKLDHKLETSIGSLNTKLETSIGSLRSEMGYIKWFIAGSIGLAAVISRFLI